MTDHDATPSWRPDRSGACRGGEGNSDKGHGQHGQQARGLRWCARHRGRGPGAWPHPPSWGRARAAAGALARLAIAGLEPYEYKHLILIRKRS